MPKFGDWQRLEHVMRELSSPRRLDAHLLEATTKNAIEAQRSIVLGIRQQWPDWQPLAPSTVKARLRKGHKSPAGIKMLMDTGQLLNAITYHVYDGLRAAVGVVKGAKRKDGGDLVNVAAVHEYGSVDGRIPARPYLRRGVLRVQKAMVERWAEAVKRIWQ